MDISSNVVAIAFNASLYDQPTNSIVHSLPH